MDGVKKSTHFHLIMTSFSAKVFAKTYIWEMVLNRVPLSIISYYCSPFKSQFCISFSKGLGTQMRNSTLIDPHIDGQDENTIKTL